MEIISFIVLILLSLVGYSAGAVGKAGKSVALKPQIIDLALVLFIWAGAVYSRIALDLNKWLMILAWVVLSSLVGILAVWPRKVSVIPVQAIREQKKPRNFLKKLWQSWENFSRRMGNFQSRIVFSWLFLIFISPFALAVKMFSDPLIIKRRSSQSHWLPKERIQFDREQFRRQF